MEALSEATGPVAQLFQRYSEERSDRPSSLAEIEEVSALASAIRCYGYDPANPDQGRHFSVALAQLFRLRDGGALDGRHLSAHEIASATAAAYRAWSEVEAEADSHE